MTTKETTVKTVASRWSIWRDHHLYGLMFSLGRVTRKPVSALMTMLVMGLALALPLGLILVLSNLSSFAGSVQQSRDIHLFLKVELDGETVQALVQQLEARADVATVAVQSPEEGLIEFRRNSGLGEAIDALTENPLPYLLIVTPNLISADMNGVLVADLQALSQVDSLQYDAQWRQRLNNWLEFGKRLVLVLSILFGLGAILVLGNTVRLDIQLRREEIQVLQLLGASNGFIRRPFLYLGIWYGLGAGGLALLLLWAGGWALQAPLLELVGSYGSHFSLKGLSLLPLSGFLFIAVLMGWLGAWLVTSHFLRQVRAIAH